MSEHPDNVHTLTIERMGYGADGISHLPDGKVAFVHGAIPGDVVRATVVEDKRRYARCEAVDVIEPSIDRVTPPDGLLRSIAPWADMSYGLQLSAKERNVRDALSRTGRFDDATVDRAMRPIRPSERESGYRNKVELSVARDGRGRIELGFKDGRDRFVPFEGKSLGIVDPIIQEAPRKLAGALRYVLRDDDSGLFRVGLRGSSATGSVELALWTRPGPFPRAFASHVLEDAISATSVVRVIADEGAARRVRRVEVLSGKGFWSERMDVGGGMLLKVSAPSFFQVNTQVASAVVREALDAISSRTGGLSGKRIADLYCGAGTFTIPLASEGADVLAVEVAGSSMRDLERNASALGVEPTIVCDDVEHALRGMGGEEACFDAVMVDPPRSGISQDALEGIMALRSPVLVYMSCDPQTFARDAGRLASAGWTLESVVPYDMFPQTWHVETLAVFHSDI